MQYCYTSNYSNSRKEK